jgi:hypothetical protein
VFNTTIVGGGRLHPAAIGVLVMQSSGNRIEHNTISDLYYTGISVGWSWGYAPTTARDNRIANNRISRIGQEVLSDMGGIYTLGVSPGTVLEHNFISDVKSFTYGGWGIYFDEGTSGAVARGNATLNTRFAGFHQHYGRENLLENNIFAFGEKEQLARSRAEDHRSFTFRRNIVCGGTTEILSGNWSGSNFTLDRNIYWNAGGTSVTLAGKGFEEWQAQGQDAHSFVMDPGFMDARGGDFRVRSNEALARIGFQPIPFAVIGAEREGPLPNVAPTFARFAVQR